MAHLVGVAKLLNGFGRLASTDDGRSRRGLSRTHPRRAAGGLRLHAAHDLLSHRHDRPRRVATRRRRRRLRGGEALPGAGDHQLGAEILGHSINDYTRYSFSVLSSNDGRPDTPSNSYDIYGDFTQGFEVPKLGLQRVGAYGYFGTRSTFSQTSNGNPIVGAGLGNRSFSRTGVYGWWYLGKFDLITLYQHGEDNVFLGNGIPANQIANLPPGAAGPTWNGGFVEAHYTYNPQLIFFAKYETVQMSRQANPAIRKDLGDVRVWTIA